MSNPGFTEELPALSDSWLDGDLAHENLPPREQRLARLMLIDAELPVLGLTGSGNDVHSPTWDQFKGVEHD